MFHWRFRLSAVCRGPALGAALACMIPAAVSATPWSEVSAPSRGAAEVIGGAANGCIGGAEALPAAGQGYVSVRRYRNRYYGHPRLLGFIRDMGRAQSRRGEPLLMVGDLSQPRGGRMPSSHRSHQNGLDVDIWFTLASSPAAAGRLMNGRSDPPSMVAGDRRHVSANWGPDQRFLVESAARHAAVERLFVNAAIKRDLCEHASGDRRWLRKVRPWWGHDAHVHVRLVCPEGSPRCEPQAPVPAGDGCGEELAWWFTEEALNPSKKGGGKPRAAPETPAACLRVLRAD